MFYSAIRCALQRSQFQRLILPVRCFSEAISPKLSIIFGSQTGTAESFANDLEFDATDKGIDTEIIDAKDFHCKDISDKGRTYAFIMASYGEGVPTDNAQNFFVELSDDSINLQSSRYAVFGLGNSQCFQDRFNVVAKGLDTRLNQLHGQRVLDLGIGDASKNQFESFSEWKLQLLDNIEKSCLPSTSASPPAPQSSNSPSQSPTPSTVITSQTIEDLCLVTAQSSAAPQQVCGACAGSGPLVPLALSARQLAMIPHDRQVIISSVKEVKQHFIRSDEMDSAVSVSFDIFNGRSPAAYDGHREECPETLTVGLQAGDHVGVFAPNSSIVIARFAAHAALSAADLDKPMEGLSQSESITLQHVLTWQLQLSGPAPLTALKVLERWANEASLTVTTKHLRYIIDEYDAEIRGRAVDIAGVLAMIPCSLAFPRFPIARLLKTLPPISPRLYSLITNPPQHRLSATLLCRLLRYRDDRLGIVSGLASSYLCERLRPGDEAAIFFREAAFHLPARRSVPIIMICGGTGIAPFLSFLEERQRVSEESGDPMGEAVLYYGCRNSTEYMFRTRLTSYLRGPDGRQGVLDRLVVCFSCSSELDNNGYTEKLQSSQEGEEVIREVLNITDIVTRQTPLLVPLMRNHARIYVCGGAGNFGNAVRGSVEALVRKSYSLEEIGVSDKEDSTSHYGVRHLVAQRRYFEDLAD